MLACGHPKSVRCEAPEVPHWEGVKLCTSATFGDVGFALVAFWMASISARSRAWLMSPKTLPLLVYLGVGVALTIGFEYYYTQIAHRWAYC